MTETQWVKQVDGSSFARDVLEMSKQTPVLVDFWATWCGPCRTLGPVLEKLANEMQGRFILAKIDSDSNQDLARQYGVRGIPAVMLFVDGAKVGDFTGALPESQVRRFLDKSLPSAVDKQVQQAKVLEARQDLEGAVRLYQAALMDNPAHVAGLLGLTRVLLAAGRMEEAQASFSTLKPHEQESVEARVLAAKLCFSAHAGDTAVWEARVADNPNDLAARLGLGEALIAQEHYEAGLEQFLEVVRRDRKFNEEAGRKAVIRVFDLLGPRHPLVATFRPRLSALLFS